MTEELNIGIIGDFDPSKPSHPATNNALQHSAARLDVQLTTSWLPTALFNTREALMELDKYDAVLASPGSPYRSMDGALRAIKQARLFGKPFLAN